MNNNEAHEGTPQYSKEKTFSITLKSQMEKGKMKEI